MFHFSVRRILTLLFSICLVLVTSAQEKGEFTITKPLTHKNLTVYLVQGRSNTTTGNLLTLQEAMEKNLVIVHETGEVNELEIENRSGDWEVFIQAGDIVKGGKQDRVLAQDFILPMRSGRVPISSFCVEQGRWRQRGDEELNRFSGSTDQISTRTMKIAVKHSASQGEVWNKVAEAQDKLSNNLSGSVRSTESTSSYQLTLENEKVVEKTGEYIKNLSGFIDGQKNAIGCVMVINGEVSSADMYPSPDLFQRLWPKILKAAVVEAISESRKETKFDIPAKEKIGEWLEEATTGESTVRHVNKRVTHELRESGELLYFETRDEKRGTWVHKNYLRK